MIAQITNGMNGGGLPAPDSPMAIGWVCIILVCIIVGINAVIDLWRKLTGADGKRDVTIAKDLVGKHEFEKHLLENREEHVRFDARIGGVDRSGKAATDEKIEKLRVERREDMQNLHQDINAVGRKVSGLEVATGLQNQTLAQIQTKLDRLAERKH